ncbi:MAG: hypoxanthine phosphoribosyltransferase [Ruminiclostridium sp.]|nr:hypoxanthine phosphoribosyltransferase [Ruminiclostridium sp.]
MHNDVERILFSEDEIRNAVAALGKRIAADVSGNGTPLFIGILKGSFIFMADLVRETGINCEMDFMIAKSYGNSTVSSGTVNIVKDISADITGRDVIVVEDILDTARTLAAVKELLLSRSPASVKICTLLDKVTAKRVSDLKADYKCFDVGNEFVVGYGLDYAEKYRNLKYIGVLKREVYEK